MTAHDHSIQNKRAAKDHPCQNRLSDRPLWPRNSPEFTIARGHRPGLEDKELEDSQHVFGIGRMRLEKILPGDYVLQVIVTDRLAKEKNSIATQSMDFEIRE